MQKKTVAVVGNCVAQRLQNMLADFPGFSERYSIVRVPMMHILRTAEEWGKVARTLAACDLIFSQPLFSFGPCNTSALQASLKEEQDLLLFSSPNFDAYFPDAVVLQRPGPLRWEPAFDWDSIIIFSCFVRGVSIFAVNDIYLAHPLFHEQSIRTKLVQSLESYAKRESGLHLPTGPFFFKNYAREKLLHSPKHPIDSVLTLMLGQMTKALELPDAMQLPPIDGFGFNRWPVITRHHRLFSFPEEASFVIGGREFCIEDLAMAYYEFYKYHPAVVEANKDKCIALE